MNDARPMKKVLLNLVASACALFATLAHTQVPRGSLDLHTPPLITAVPRDPPQEQPGADGNHQIDLLLVHTTLFAERAGGAAAAEARAQQLAALTNSYFANSMIPVRLRVVGTVAFTATDERATFNENLDTLALDASLRRLRDERGADLVALLRTSDFHVDLCGLATGFNGLERAEGAPTNVSAERDAFAVAGAAASADGFQCADYILAHELGHVLGAGHAYAKNPGPYYWRPYAHAAACGGAAGKPAYASIMHGFGFNTNGLNDGMIAGEFFSNPRLLIEGQACGSTGVPGVESTQADNARSITEAAPYVAAYRQGASTQRVGSTAQAGAINGLLLVLLLSALRYRVRLRI